MASVLLKKRVQFTSMVARLILHAEQLGYQITIGEVYRHKDATHGHARSLHKSGLAVDMNLYMDWKYQRTTKAHKVLGEYWESLGGSWGGRFTSPDGNHYSLAHRGMR